MEFTWNNSERNNVDIENERNLEKEEIRKILNE